MVRPAHALVLAAIYVTAAACDLTDLFDTNPEGPSAADCPPLPTTQVYYGTNHPSHVPLEAGQILAVGTWRHCSGTLIAPSWVLTANHCQIKVGDSFCVGVVADEPEHCIPAVEVLRHPDRDQSLVRLERDVRESLPGVRAIPIMTEPMDDSWLCKYGEAAGYGRQEDGRFGERKFTAEPIVLVTEHYVGIDGGGDRGVCFGDSGGPVMVVASDGSVRVAGGLSAGAASCVERDQFARPDVSWIEQYTGPTKVDGDADCIDVSAQGQCVGAMALWCKDGRAQTQMCEGPCGWDAQAKGYRCLPPGADPCGGVDAAGYCDGEVVVQCVNGAVQMMDCAAAGETCWVDQAGASCAATLCADGADCGEVVN
jgi:hypothetical protein